PESRVALYLNPAPRTVVALLAVLKAGGAYVPLDPSSPAERLAYVLEDSGAQLVLTHPELAGLLPPHGIPELQVEDGAFDGEPTHAPESGVESRNLAYVIYTSGSTGRPKGVLVPHRGVINSIQAYTRIYDIGPGAHVLLFAPLHFDGSVLDLFTALCSGAALVVARREDLIPGRELIDLLERQRVTHAKFTPSALAATPHAELPLLRAVMSGGETCTAEVVARWAPGRRFFNGYGPTETSVRVTVLECTDGTRPPPIGWPVDNVRLYVLDAALNLVPVGVRGELYIGGPGVTRGYGGRPDLTAEKFLPDPFTPTAGARMYRSGDRVRWLPDGTVEFIGRTDDQVKIRGFRIEPGEIEVALMRHPGLADAAVVPRASHTGEARLVAYVVPGDGAAPEAAELRAHLKERLPEYMVPAAFVTLAALPLTSNGKLDTRALPEPELSGAGAEAYVAPSTATEAVLAEIWEEVLGVERVGVHDDFFALGGHSLLATRVTARVHEALGVNLPLRTLFDASTVAELSVRVDALEPAGAPGGGRKIARRSRNAPLPLSFAQQRLWFIDRLEPGSSAYNMAFPLRLRGALDVPALRRSLAELVRRHETLRTTFGMVDGEAVQVIAPAGPVALPVTDLGRLPREERERTLLRLAAEESGRPFDLERGPLLRAAVVRLGDEEWAVLFALHHIISDGWSTGILVREVSELYGALSTGREPALPPLPVQYGDYAAWQRDQLAGRALEEQVGWWRERLAGAPPVLELPTDRPRPPVPGPRSGVVRFALPDAVADSLRRLGQRQGTTPFMTLLAGWQALLARYSGEADVVVGTPIAGRNRVELEGLIGFFVNTLVVRADLSGDPTFTAALERVREATLDAFAHQDVPFERLVEELQPERSLQHTPLFQVMFSLQKADAGGGLRLGTLAAEPLLRGEDAAKFDLSLTIVDGEDLGGTLAYRAELWEESTIERMAGHFTRLLAGVAADPGRRLSEVEVLDEAERRRVLAEWSVVEVPVALDVPVHERIAEQARRTPEAVAVRSGAEVLTFAELEGRANRLARALRRRGVGPEVPVGLCLERSAAMLVGALGILKAGGTYVPLDPGYPADRLAYMLDDAGIRVLVTAGDAAAALPEHGAEVLRLDADAAGIAAESADAPEPLTRPDTAGLAYVIYTSGSTGRPKGVRVEHRSLSNTLDVARQVFGFAEGDEMPSLASFAFDIWFFETLLPLMSGSTVRVVPRERVVDVAALAEELESATLLHAVPALMRQVAQTVRESGRGTLPRLRRAFVGGDAVPPDLLAEMREVFP
ncbi:MAG: amino acid adenylation domain-containing protein, partial [Gemmatimonadetes bacterium]|nr:amino acid adenylation domain-containing protein [Gemmatimonadota bacterium]